MQIILFCLVITAVFAGCVCPSVGCRNMFYAGTIENCYCFCQQQAKTRTLSAAATCTYSPRIMGYTNGHCSLCDDYLPASSDGFAQYFSGSLPEEAEAVSTLHNVNFIFPVRRCKCPSRDCNRAFSGTYEQCIAWAKTQASLFVDGKWTATYVPRSTVYMGGCTVCGPTDPCKPFD
ncbi:hypothetical protein RCL1_008977 [Eukaryota sp. TZLM3-RCL]